MLNVVGDLNVNLLKRDPDSKCLREMMARHGLTNLINTPMHFKQNLVEASVIDLFMTTDPELYSQHGTCPNIVSDHYVIFGARKKFKVKHDKTRIMACKYKNLD